MSQALRIAVLLVCVLPTAACVTLEPRGLDARFAAGWRPSKAYCAFGAETPALAAWCAEVNFGKEGLLALARAVNEEVLAPDPELSCTEHVALARRELAAYPAYRVRDLYSCDAEPPLEDGRPVCHVSLLVSSDVSGAQVVMDNGYVLHPDTTGGVAFYRQFAAQVDRHWVGQRPDWVALAATRGVARRAR